MPDVEITASLLEWARKDVALSVDDAAERLGTTPVRLARFEAGDENPTLTHLNRMATAYQRPLAFFFLSKPPETRELPADFRLRTVDGQPPAMTRELVVAIRKARSWQSTASRLLEHDPGLLAPANLPIFSAGDDPSFVADSTRSLLTVEETSQLDADSAGDALTTWRLAVEDQGVLVFSIGLSRDVARGFSLLPDDGPPVIALARESGQARLFTLLHEFAHLLVRTDAICTQFEDSSPHGTVERFCNRVAAQTLLPLSIVRRAIILEFGLLPPEWTNENLLDLAHRVNVSVPAVALRLEELEFAPPGTYDQWMAQEAPPFTPQAGGGGGSNSWPAKRITERGEAYSKIVFDAWNRGLIATGDAARAMNMPPRYVSRIETTVSRRRERFGN